MSLFSNYRRCAASLKPLASAIVLIAALLTPSIAAGDALRAPDAPNATIAGERGRHLVIENVGQFAPEARFTLAQGRQRVWLADDAIWLVTYDSATTDVKLSGRTGAPGQGRRNAAAPRSGTALRFTFSGANPAARPEPFGRTATQVSYLIGNDPSRWLRDVPAWAGVRYHELYPGVDLVVGGDASGAIPWRLEARSSEDARAVGLLVEGAAVAPAAGGLIRVETARGVFDLAAPTWAVGNRRDATASVVSAATPGGALSLSIGGSEPSAATASQVEATAAEDLIYSRLAGSSLIDAGNAVAVDYAGSAYVTGVSGSSEFPTVPGSFDTTYGGATDAFVAKFSPDGMSLLYATYIGGSGLDLGSGVAVNGTQAYVVGETSSTDFPGTTGASGANDIFVVSLNGTGTALRYASLIGGTDYELAGGIAVWGADTYIVGSTDSTDLAGTGCAGITPRDVVVARLSSAGAPIYVRCYGGNDLDEGAGIDVAHGVAYVTGNSWSTDLTLPAQPAGEQDILVAAFNPDGTLQDALLTGGLLGDQGQGIAAEVDADGNGYLHVAGWTASGAFPLAAGAGPGANETDGVVLRVDVTSFTADLATFLGGGSNDAATAIAIDTTGALYLSGYTESTDFTMTPGAYDTSHNQRNDAFVARMRWNSAAADKLTYATLLGDSGDDFGYGVATDTGGHAFASGSTGSQLFPTTSGPGPAGEDDMFAARVKVSSPPDAPVVSITVAGTDAQLTWEGVLGASKYQVFRGSAPYYKPGEWNSTLVSEPTTGPFVDTGALGSADGYFYEVKSISAAPEQASASSSRVGKFTYALVKGN